MTDIQALENNAVCPSCKEPFRCGVTGGDATCWCMSLPPVTPSDRESSCLCPKCLEAEAKRQAEASGADFRR